MAGADHPVLQLDQFTLQAKQLPEILAAALLVLRAVARGFFTRKFGQRAVFKLHLQLFVIAVDQFVTDTPHQFFIA